MRFDRYSFAMLLVAGALVAGASPALAQVDSVKSEPKAQPMGGLLHLSGGYLAGSFPMGDWGKIAGFGLALDGADVVKKAGKPIGVRSSLGLLYNFSRTVDIPASQLGPTDKLSLETKNWSLFFGLGPELSMPKPVSPFVYGTVGFDTYWTSSTLSGTALGLPYSAEHGDSRITFAWAAGLGIRKKIGAGYGSELSAEYRSGMDHEYLRPEDVHVSGGAVTATRTKHASDQIIIRIGTVLGGPALAH